MERVVVGGVTVFDDSYNSNPESLRAAVRVLSGLHGHARRVLVLGDMLELGPTEVEQHRETIRLAQDLDLDLLGLVGPRFGAARNDDTLWAAEAEHLGETLRKHLRPGDIVLIKGSRGIKMERVLNGLEPKETA